MSIVSYLLKSKEIVKPWVPVDGSAKSQKSPEKHQQNFPNVHSILFYNSNVKLIKAPMISKKSSNDPDQDLTIPVTGQK